MLYQIVPLKLFKKTFQTEDGLLTYSSAEPLKPGHLVLIPLGRSTTVGIVHCLAPSQTVDFSVKSILKLLYSTPLPSHLLQALFWLSRYYLIPLPQAATLLLPPGITKTRRRLHNHSSKSSISTPPAIPLNSAQKQALSAIKSCSASTKLLHGVTGSGKTNLYLTLTKSALENQTSIILLVPEIALTSQLVQIFTATFGDQVVLLHSQKTESERHQIWEQLLQSTKPHIVIGPRSALFAPLLNLGLIIIDEAHESAYFQENTPKYSALRLASFLAKTLKITCLQGTATPLIADYYLAKQNHALITLRQKAKTTAITPHLTLIDLKNRQDFLKNRYFSDPLLSQIQQNLQQHHQTLIFHNRRGSAPLTICEKCGWQAFCPTCFLPLTLHTDAYNLSCHTCGYHAKVPTSCPSCGHPGVIHKGFGTKLLAQELKKLFPTAQIARFDGDNSKDSSLSSLYQAVKSGQIDIIIGTQSIAKGLDLPHLATVGIIQADTGLHLPDYAAEERTFHLIMQVLGRIGRGHLNQAHAFIQTFQPDHPVITSALQSDYSGFFDYLLKKRHQAHLPPFTYLAKLSVTYKTEALALSKIKSFHQQLSTHLKLRLSPPLPTFHERTASGYTWQVILRSTSRQYLLQAISSLPSSNHLHFTLDPPSLL